MTIRSPLRLWPGLLIALLVALLRFVVPLVLPDAMLIGIVAGILGLLLVIVWWLFFSRARWIERIGGVLLMVLGMVVTNFVVDPSISTGMMGRMFYVYAAPSTLAIAFVLWAFTTRHLAGPSRWITMALAVMVGCGVWTLMRSEGIRGAGADMAWRWTPTAEERLLAQTVEPPVAVPAVAPAPAPAAPPTTPDPTASDAAASKEGSSPVAVPAPADPDPRPVDWAGFRGAERDGIVRGVQISTDWTTAGPVELWRRPVGPGWSSFAVDGDRIYTQEQRGDHELVSAYRLSSGAPLWRHRDTTRFWESNGGAGPRATPTLSGGRLYAFGATGILNALDASTGARIWSRNVATDAGKKVPMWGFSSSPLVLDDLVVVAAAGKLAAYDRATGKPRWFGPNGGGYSSPQLVTINGVDQIVFMNSSGATSMDPADGTVLWEYKWEGSPIVQPAQLEGDNLLISSADMMGGMDMRRLAISRQGTAWTVQERWSSRGLKPYFNDFVVHKGHAYGFDGSILSCIELEAGDRKWKGGRYGQGQFVLLADQDLLLVLSEDGDVALVSATTDEHRELATFKALEGKTWNHPVVVRDILLVRNGEEMAAFRLPAAPR
jgi:outer membrane protein assembly factor BamB